MFRGHISETIFQPCFGRMLDKIFEIFYSDLKAGLEVLSQHLDWETIHGLYSNAIYGGRVDDVHDIRILLSYLHSFFNTDVIAGSSRARSSLGPLNLPVTNR